MKTFPLTRRQLEIYFHQSLFSAPELFNIGGFIKIQGALDIETLQAALAALMEHTPALRIAIDDADGQPRQVLCPRHPRPLTVIDTRGEPEPERAAREWTERDFAQAFAFDGQTPLAAYTLLRHGEEDFILYGRFHHIAFDGWAIAQLYSEKCRYYNHLRQGLLPAPTPMMTPAELVEEEDGYYESRHYAKDRQYWQDKLAGYQTRLFADAGGQLACGQRSFQLSAETYKRIGELAAAHQATVFHFFIGLIYTHALREFGADDLLLALPILNRRNALTKNTPGLFASLCPLRLKLQPHWSFAELLSLIQRELRADFRHHRYPIGETEGLGRDRLPYEISLSYEKHDYDAMFDGTVSNMTAMRALSQHYPLKVFVREADSRQPVKVDLDYNLTSFAELDAAAFIDGVEPLLHSLLRDPEQTLAKAPRLAEPLAPIAPPHPDLCSWFEHAAQAFPERVAVQGETSALRYQELDARANQLARQLLQLGVQPEQRVGLCCQRQPDLLVAMLAILKAGAAYVPLDPGYPAERLEFLVRDSAIHVVVGDAESADALPAGLALRWLDVAVSSGDAAPPPRRLHPQQAAYVIYTSGSTGTPKGCVVSHHNVVRLIAATAERFAFGPDDVWSLFHSYAFDFSVWEIWGPLLFGGTCLVVPYWVSRSPEAFADWLQQHRVSVLNQTPAAFRQLIPAAAAHALPDLRLVIFGGEALELASLEPWFQQRGDQRPELVNMYGITETTVHVTQRAIRQADLDARKGQVIGPPIPDLAFHLLDRFLQPVPIGVPGEIYVGGPGVARGYWNRPTLTASRFLPNPFAADGSRLYRSGDLARRRADGEIEYLGRADHQVKLRGFRIELGEIEAALCRLPAVREALVLLDRPAAGEPRLVAYAVGDAEPAALRAALAAELPEHMLPAVIVALERFPLTHHGKIDRAALPAAQAASDAPRVEPRSDAERALAQIWADVLAVPLPGIDDNFFALGGDSILSLQVVARARDQGLALNVQQLFSRPTIRQLCEAPEPADDGASAAARQAFSLISDADRLRLPDDVIEALPMSRLQAGMLFHSELSQNGAIFHDIFSFDLRLPWDEAAWRAAVRRLAERHAALRTTFHWNAYSEPLQLIHRDGDIPLSVADLRALAPEAQSRALADFVAAEKARPFQPQSPPLLRLSLFRLDTGRARLTLSFHHAILDGWSVATLVTDLLRLARHAQSAGPADASGALSALFIEQEKQAENTPELKAAWRQRLAGLEASVLPRLRPQPATGGARSVRRLSRMLPAELSMALDAAAARLALPLKTVLLTAHLRVLALLTGSAAASTGYVTHSRPEREDSAAALGLFLNTVPLSVALRTGSWAQLARRVFAEETALQALRRLPLAAIMQLNHGRRGFEVGFNYIHFHVYGQALRLPDVTVEGVEVFEETDFPCLVQFSRDPRNQGLELTLAWDEAEFDAPQMEDMAGYLQGALASLAEDTDADWLAAPLLNAEQAAQALGPAPVSVAPPHPDLCSWFEHAAQAFPERVAVQGETSALRYRELDARANQLARQLLQLGVQPEQRVGLCCQRQPDLLVAMLAILKAGAAYVPLDPGYPAERLEFLVRDSAIHVVVGDAESAEALPAGLALRWLDVAVSSGDAAPPPRRLHPQQAAYVIYTSGSTGTPKGCVVSHHNVVRLIAATAERFAFGPDDVWSLFHSYAFDFSVWEIWGPLLFGGTCLVVPYWVSRSPEAFADWLQQHRVSVLNQTPAAFRQLIPAAAAHALPDLRLVIFGGEALELASLEPWFQQRGDQRPELVNMYGITETTVHVTQRAIRQADLDARKGQVIGPPIPDLAFHLLDRFLQPVPIGVPGEIYVGGPGVARGYWNRPTLTASRFLPNPFAADGSRLYRSGDLARRRADGEIEYLGRADHQVKLRGFRIELGEIEAALCRLPAVREALVLLDRPAAGEPRLVAYAVGDAEPAALRAALAAELPEHMLPAVIVALERFPLTHHGKIDRAALPAPEPLARRAFEAARTPSEFLVAEVFADLLQLPQVSRDESFFELGGDSILAVRAANRLRERLGVPLPLRLLFEHPRAAELAQHIDAQRGQTSAASPVRQARRQLARVTFGADGDTSSQQSNQGQP
ncbi:non-ribosomal peptide synthetase [Chromobacterium haemolyticum]|uniref:jagaricin-like haemolysin non-ribosomal peptide synthetase HmlA n=1 Tax=Chromobacterium haemolyticum TaxID=394935 RepID=UPI001746E14B|nr:non-ribosomal peptide synthetase [Chromobacterium haemolyticum]QOD83521.1 amino acid adenylation domain-containing protein [Chromobacterium haemolyticum]